MKHFAHHERLRLRRPQALESTMRFLAGVDQNSQTTRVPGSGLARFSMPGFGLLAFCLLAGTATPAMLRAQEPAPPSASPVAASSPVAGSSQASGPTLQPSPAVQMRSLEPSADEEYTLGGGDEITVEVPGHPELSGKHTVGPDGRITLPTAGTVNLGGLSREQASSAIEKAYDTYYRSASASVSIDKYGSNRVMVTGAVQHQGYVYFQQTPTLLDAITQAGLVEPSATRPGSSGASAAARTTTLPQECTIYEQSGDKQIVATVDLHKLLTNSSGMSDLRLRRNAMIFVPNPHDRFVSVMGEVLHTGPVELTSDMNLPSVIAAAGGLSEHAGNNPNIAIVDPATKKTRYVRYDELITAEGMNEVALHPGELVIVPKARLAKVGYVFQQVAPITGLAGIFAVTMF